METILGNFRRSGDGVDHQFIGTQGDLGECLFVTLSARACSFCQARSLQGSGRPSRYSELIQTLADAVCLMVPVFLQAALLGIGTHFNNLIHV